MAKAASTTADADTDVCTTLATGSLLDVGAGDGNVTAKLATLHKKVVATEISKHMTTRLAQKGFMYALCTVPPS